MAVGTATTLPIGPDPTAVEVRKAIPIKWWAATGVVALAVWGYVWVRWIAGGIVRAKVGTTPIPHTMKILLYANQAAMLPLFLVGIYWFIVRPWRRDRRISFDGMLMIAFQTGYWQEQWANFLKPSYIFNTGLISFNSWARYMPGMSAPNAKFLDEPLVWMWPMYSTFCIPMVILGCYIMKRAKIRWPSLGTMGLVGISIVSVAVFDVIAECSLVRMGMYIYPTASPRVSLFAGHYYQFPLYETLFMVTTYAPIICLRYFRDDKGRTLLDRGVDSIRAGARQKTWLRFLALVGGWNLIFFLGYNAPLGVVSGAYGGSIPQDVQQRSYFMNGYCGPGTKYSCGSPKQPIVTSSSGYLTPDGQYVPKP